jgi:(p)ppGpp synthase/HD superfamily hydrolase
MTELEKKAYHFAKKKHEGQFRRDGVTPYFKHIGDVYLRVDDDEDLGVIALLHDVFEDTDATEADLFNLGFSFKQVQAVKVLTKKKGQSYKDYLEGVKQNELAKKVKIADMLANLSDKPTEKQIKKYALGLVYLTDAVL